MKIVISDPKTGKSYQKEITKGNENFLIGKKIGDKIDGSFLGLNNYVLEITGGSDSSGFPMRKDLIGTRRAKLLLTKGVGFRTNKKGLRKKKTVRGNTIASDIAQVNCKVVSYGEKSLEEYFSSEKK